MYEVVTAGPLAVAYEQTGPLDGWPVVLAHDETFARTAESFDNPDFVEVVIHSYRHRFGLVAGDSALADVESRLAGQPRITVPTITIDGEADGVVPASDGSAFAAHYSSTYEHLRIPDVGHNVPQESPAAFAEAILRLHHDVG